MTATICLKDLPKQQLRVNVATSDCNTETKHGIFFLDFYDREWCHGVNGEINPHKLCEGIWELQGNNPRGTKVHDDQPTISVGDLLFYDHVEHLENGFEVNVRTEYFLAAPCGFVKIQHTTFLAWQALGDLDRPFFARELYRLKGDHR